MSSSSKPHLNLEQRSKILKLSEEGLAERAIAREMGTSKGTVGRVKRQQKDDIEKLRNEQGEIPDHLKKRKIVQINPQYEDIENAVLNFIELARERGMSVTGPMLMELGKREATKRGINNFKASEGWLDKVKKRHGIVGKNLSGEAVAVDKILVKN